MSWLPPQQPDESAKSDCFSLAVLLNFLLTGEHPFGNDPTSIEHGNRLGTFPDGRLSRDAAVVVAGLAHKDPQQRWSVATALRSELARRWMSLR